MSVLHLAAALCGSLLVLHVAGARVNNRPRAPRADRVPTHRAPGPLDSLDHTHDIVYDSNGVLDFLQLESARRAEALAAEAAEMGHSILYPVQVNFDIEEMKTSKGMTMVFDKKHHIMRLDVAISNSEGIAWGRYDDNIKSSGWSELFIEQSTSQEVSNDVKMYSSGYIEGLLTCVRMSEYMANTHQLLLKDEATKHSLSALKSRFKNELVFMKAKANLVPHIMTEEPKDPYWKHSRYILFQIWGIVDGYNFAAHHFGVHTLDLLDMILVNSGGELPELMDAYTPKAIVDRTAAQTPTGVFLIQKQAGRLRRGSVVPTGLNTTNRKANFLSNAQHLADKMRQRPMDGVNSTDADPLDDVHWERKVRSTGRCSALIRVTEGNADLYVGHTTWDDFSEMLRIFKYYKFVLEGSLTMATHIGFSSYPGLVSSTDDFYIMNSGLAVMETSIELLDPFIYDKVMDFPALPHVPNFVHLMITNRMAKNGVHWTQLMQTQNTGTYNAQWLITDYNVFKAGSLVPDNTLWVLEMIPGKMHTEDLSHFLRNYGYWPSFNRPYFDVIRDAAGHAAAQQTHGKLYSWGDNPRAEIFKTSIAGVNTNFDMRGIMNRNLYPLGKVLPNDPGHDISARFDLSPVSPIPNGGIDAKVTSRCLFKDMGVQAISGPSHDNQKPFSWKKSVGEESWPGYPHIGQPDTFNFQYIQIGPAAAGAIMDITDC